MLGLEQLAPGQGLFIQPCDSGPSLAWFQTSEWLPTFDMHIFLNKMAILSSHWLADFYVLAVSLYIQCYDVAYIHPSKNAWLSLQEL